MMTKILTVALIVMVSGSASGASGVLDEYVEEGLESNLALKQAGFSLEKSRAALREARGLFFPSVGINARYTRAGGGRYFEFPVGDMVNPIHDALNQLIGEPRFPKDVPNVNTPLLREEEHETKLQVVQPLFQPAIYYNYRINSHLVSAEEAGREAFKQDLVLEIKTAYYNYLKAVEFVKLAGRTEGLLRENLRVSRSLFENEKATKDVVYRAQAELSEIEQQIVEAEKGRNLARAYFNFLLNRPLDSAIEADAPDGLPPEPEPETPALFERALAKRYEPSQLKSGIEAARSGVKLAWSAYLPDVLFAFDYGFEGEVYRFTQEDDFWTGSLVLQWNLFSGLQRGARLGQARAEEKQLAARLEEVKQAVRLEVREARENLIVAGEAYEAATDRLESASKSFEIVSRKYKEGMVPQIEFLDGRLTMTRAEVSLITTTYDYHTRYAEYERATGLGGAGGR
jgi:outer membrane protein TolC